LDLRQGRDDPEDIQAYLTKYPDGYFVDLANDKLAKLKGAQIASAESTKNSTTTERSATPSAGQTVQPAAIRAGQLRRPEPEQSTPRMAGRCGLSPTVMLPCWPSCRPTPK